MARPIEYEPEKVLLEAMQLFWGNGYENTAIADIVKVTGMKPGSLYNLYGNKEGIFNAVVDLYASILLSQAKSLLEGSDDALKNIKDFLNEMILATLADEKTHGCLFVKTLLVLPSKDKKVQERIAMVFDELQGLLETDLKKAVDAGQTKVNPEQFSKFIITTIYGLHAYYKTHNKLSVVKQNVQQLIDILER